jgi:hypothetical protein
MASTLVMACQASERVLLDRCERSSNLVSGVAHVAFHRCPAVADLSQVVQVKGCCLESLIQDDRPLADAVRELAPGARQKLAALIPPPHPQLWKAGWPRTQSSETSVRFGPVTGRSAFGA